MADQSTDLIKGSIYKSILWFSIPLLIGNLFQQLYNTVDSYVVGNYVNSNALAAVGASTPVINMLVGFFMGLATGAGVVISQYFGARRIEKMQRAVHSSLALTGVLCVVFTVVGLLCTQPLLKAIVYPTAFKGYWSTTRSFTSFIDVFDDLFLWYFFWPCL